MMAGPSTPLEREGFPQRADATHEHTLIGERAVLDHRHRRLVIDAGIEKLSGNIAGGVDAHIDGEGLSGLGKCRPIMLARAHPRKRPSTM